MQSPSRTLRKVGAAVAALSCCAMLAASAEVSFAATPAAIHAATHSAPRSAAKSAARPAARRAPAAYPLTLKDDTGRTVRIPHRPTRILSLTLGTDEMLLSMVSPKRIIGLDYYSTNPTYSNIVAKVKQARIKPVGSAAGLPSAEALIKMRPDLVLTADYTNQKVVRQLQAAGIPVYEFTTFSSIAQIESHILILGRMVGDEAKARAMVADMNRQLAALRQKAPKRRLTVAYYSYGDVAGRNTTVNNIIADAGGVNAASKVNGWAQVSVEQLLAMNPDVIIVPNDSGAARAQLKQFLATRGVSALRAVREHHVYTAPDAQLSDVAQYITLGVRDVEQMLTAAARPAK